MSITPKPPGVPGVPNNKTSLTPGVPVAPNNKTALAVTKPAVPANKTALAVTKPAAPNTILAKSAIPFPRTPRSIINLDFEDKLFSINGVPRNQSDVILYSRPSMASFLDRELRADGSYGYFINYDFSGSSTNLLLWSEDFSNAAWTKTTAGSAIAPGVTPNYGVIAAPDGTFTADRVLFTINADSASNRSILRQTITTGADANTSIWVRSATGATQYISLHINGAASAPFLVTNEWKRIDLYGGFAGSTTYGVELVGGNGTGALTSDILIWGAQVTNTIKYRPYTKTTTASASTVSVEQPRYEYDAATGNSQGVLSERAATNLCLFSEDFANAAWTKISMTVASNSLTVSAPDKSISVDKLIVDNAVTFGNASIRETFTKAASALTYTFSVYAKRAEFNRVQLFVNGTSISDQIAAIFDLASGTLVSITPGGNFALAGSYTAIQRVGNDWYRLTLSFVSNADTSISSRIFVRDSTATTGDGSSGVYVWGAQFEQSQFISSYIPTTSATVTRAKDVIKINASGLQVSGSQTVRVKGADYPGTQSATATNGRYLYDFDAASGRSFELENSSGGVTYRNGTTSKTGSKSASGNFDYISRFNLSSNLLDLFSDKVKQGAAVDAGSPFTFSFGDLHLGVENSEFNNLNGTIKQFSLYGIALTDDEVASL